MFRSRSCQAWGMEECSINTNGFAASQRVARTENGSRPGAVVTRRDSCRLPVGKSLPVMLPAGWTKAILISDAVPLTPAML